MANKAEYQISSSVKEGVLEITLTGKLTANAEEIQNKILDIAEAKGAKNLLVDSRDFKGRIGITEAYTSVRRDYSVIRKVNYAYVDRPENADLVSFLETTAQNAGLSFKCFTDVDSARIWLKSKQIKRAK